MIGLSITLEEPLWPDVDRSRVVHVTEGMSIGGLTDGMVSGKPSVAIRVDLPDSDQVVIAETSLALFLSAADALKARFGDPRT